MHPPLPPNCPQLSAKLGVVWLQMRASGTHQWAIDSGVPDYRLLIAAYAIAGWYDEIERINKEEKTMHDNFYSKTLFDWRKETNGISFMAEHDHNSEMFILQRIAAHKALDGWREWRCTTPS